MRRKYNTAPVQERKWVHLQNEYKWLQEPRAREDQLQAGASGKAYEKSIYNFKFWWIFTCSNWGNGILGKGNIISKGPEVEQSRKFKDYQISVCNLSMDWLKDKGGYKVKGHTIFWSSSNASIRCTLYYVSNRNLESFWSRCMN